MEQTIMLHCKDCLAYYPQGFKHQCVPWIAALVKMREAEHPLDRPHWECRCCYPDDSCPADCIQRNHHPENE